MEEDYFLLHKLGEGEISAMEVLYVRYAPQVKSFVSAILKDRRACESCHTCGEISGRSDASGLLRQPAQDGP
mgnify:CR=1 FL=1